MTIVEARLCQQSGVWDGRCHVCPNGHSGGRPAGITFRGTWPTPSEMGRYDRQTAAGRGFNSPKVAYVLPGLGQDQRGASTVIKQLANTFHGVLARGPASVARFYIELLSHFCRDVFPDSLSARVRNSIAGHGHPWSEMSFSAQQVLVGNDIKIRLFPHFGEFDEAALFSKRLCYEDAMFAWLQANAPHRYDLIIEIGANVGVFTVFFDALAQRGSRPKSIIAFEPSREAYARLLSNLKVNGATSVTTFNAAVGLASGFETFYEPEGHLTNGSFHKEFSEIFSNTVRSTTVLVVGAMELASFVSSARGTLIKIDVEGFEPQLLEAMSELIKRYRPDLLIEVVQPGIAERLETLEALAGYTRQLLSSDGPKSSAKLYASAIDRDWLLTWQGS
jgi:FkbM family methyltransferase